jgi:hypothetical protein
MPRHPRVFGPGSIYHVYYLDRVRLLTEIRGGHVVVERLPWWRRVRTDHQTVAETEVPDGAMLFNGEPAVPEIPTPSLDLLLDICCAISECPSRRMLGRSRGETEIIARRALVKVAVREFGYKSLQVARLLHKNPSSVSRWLSLPPRSTVESTLQKRIVDELTGF